MVLLYMVRREILSVSVANLRLTGRIAVYSRGAIEFEFDSSLRLASQTTRRSLQ